MTYKETLDWMFAQLPMYQQKGKVAFNGKLDTIRSFTAHLGNPEKIFKTIHVAGTNGKGSSSHMLASILQEAGYTVGLYTSPHLKDFRERIRINGKPVSKKFVVDFIGHNLTFLKNQKLSFFEMTVGMAFRFFAYKKVDIAIIEVGLGGRLDSTNIITPEVSLITNIGYDHMDILGDSLEKIAFEKAGIIKEDIPVVISETQTATKNVFKKVARDKKSELVFADSSVTEHFKTSLLGNYQAKNIKGVVATIALLHGFKIKEEHIRNGLLHVVQNTGMLGRWQVLGEHPKVVCDAAHNPEGLRAVFDQVRGQKYEKLHVILGFVKDKNLDIILPLLPKNAIYYFCKPNIPRGLDTLLLQQKAAAQGLHGDCYDAVGTALAIAIQNAGCSDFVYVGGSSFVVAEVV